MLLAVIVTCCNCNPVLAVLSVYHCSDVVQLLYRVAVFESLYLQRMLSAAVAAATSTATATAAGAVQQLPLPLSLQRLYLPQRESRTAGIPA